MVAVAGGGLGLAGFHGCDAHDEPASDCGISARRLKVTSRKVE
jgi:hypothetical protein